eukprot:scaffold3416_cov185-Amphora_coffeaeformis.AAC.5
MESNPNVKVSFVETASRFDVPLVNAPSHQEMCFLPSSVNNNKTQPEIALFGSGDKTHPNMEGH